MICMICMICMIYSHHSSWSRYFKADISPILYDLYDLYDLAHVAGWELCTLHDPAHVSWVGSVLRRSCSTSQNGRLGSRLSTVVDHDLLDLPVRRVNCLKFSSRNIAAAKRSMLPNLLCFLLSPSVTWSYASMEGEHEIAVLDLCCLRTADWYRSCRASWSPDVSQSIRNVRSPKQVYARNPVPWIWLRRPDEALLLCWYGMVKLSVRATSMEPYVRHATWSYTLCCAFICTW